MLICPVCKKPLAERENALVCPAGHSYDRAKEGYVNLLRTTKQGDAMGDSRESAAARRRFLDAGYFAPLRDRLTALLSGKTGDLLDICCGEGYYTAALAALPGLRVAGFDLSKNMVRAAAKRRSGAVLFVANLSHIPVADGTFDYAVHLFAPFQEKEFFRILKPGGALYTVVPGRRHLWGLKTLLYDTPYENDERLPRTSLLRLEETVPVSGEITLQNPETIAALFQMTPYYYRTSAADKAKLAGVETLATPISFVIARYRKPAGGE